MSPRSMSQRAAALVVGAAFLQSPAYADIVLGDPNFNATFGLINETYGSGYLQVSWDGGYISTGLSGGESKFGVETPEDTPVSVYIDLYDLSGSGARLYHIVSNIAGPPAGGSTTVDLTRQSGRIRAVVNVTGGSLKQVAMQSNAYLASDEYMGGYVTASGGDYPEQPIAVASGVAVWGTAVLRAERVQSTLIDNQPTTNRFYDVAANDPSFNNLWTGIAQSFTAPTEEMVFGFYTYNCIPFGESETYTLKLYSGEGVSDSLLAERAVVVAGADGCVEDLLEVDFSDVPLSPGAQYTVEITTTYPDSGSYASVGVRLNDGGYGDGRFYHVGSPSSYDPSQFANLDLNFRVRSASGGCDVPVQLPYLAVDTITGQTVDAVWTFDLSSEKCDLGSIAGSINYNGFPTDASPSGQYVYLWGAESRDIGLSPDATSYLFDGLGDGNYWVGLYSYFNPPFDGVTGWPTSPELSVSRGKSTTYDLSQAAAAIRLRLTPEGTWGAADMYSGLVLFYNDGYGGYGLDYGYQDGRFDILVPAGDAFLNNLSAYFFESNSAGYTFSSYQQHMYTPNGSLLTLSLDVGDDVDAGSLALETSELEQYVFASNPSVNLQFVKIYAHQSVYDASGIEVGRNIIESETRRYEGMETNGASILLRGVPGTYQFSALSDGDDGGSYGALGSFVLGAPINTPAGSNVLVEFESEAGAQLGSVVFDNVMAGGETTLSRSSSGPPAPDNFQVAGAESLQYYDIRSTAEFDVATVCIDYDDSNISPVTEGALKLYHHICDADGANCAWEDITSPGYPDVIGNVICGVTGSFSIFAIMEPLDQDGDGVFDGNDNCPATPNADQADFDGDGTGDACEVDTDNDGLIDDIDLCPMFPSDNNQDLDGDGVGDVCDDDLDGDGVLNVVDNCPASPNQSQSDFDGDGFGDACDPDDDNDTVADADDECEGTQLGSLIDGLGCSSPQRLERACPFGGQYRNHGNYVSCVAHEAKVQVFLGLIDEEGKGDIVSAAAMSDVGK